MSEYITVAGLIQFDPRTRQAGGSEVRDIVIQAIGLNKNFSITVWPDKISTDLEKGDFIVVTGKHTQSVGQNKAGEQVTYNNMSATTLLRFAGNGSDNIQTASKVSAPAAGGDNFPF